MPGIQDFRPVQRDDPHVFYFPGLDEFIFYYVVLLIIVFVIKTLGHRNSCEFETDLGG